MANVSALNCQALLSDTTLYTGAEELEAPDSQRYVVTALLGALVLVTVVGNVMVILCVARFAFLHVQTNVFIVSLAMADVGVALLDMPLYAYKYFARGWHLGPHVCMLVHASDVILCSASVLNLCCLALDRYTAICRPFLHRKVGLRHVVALLVFSWTFPVLTVGLPVILGLHHVGIEELGQCSAALCEFVGSFVFEIVSLSTSFYLPTLFMVVCYWRILVAARRHFRAARNLQAGGATIKTEDSHFRRNSKAAKTLCVIMGCFCLSWFPFSVIRLVNALVGFRLPSDLVVFTQWLGYCNSTMNPFLYYLCSRPMKQAYKHLLACGKKETSPPATHL